MYNTFRALYWFLKNDYLWISFKAIKGDITNICYKKGTGSHMDLWKALVGPDVHFGE
jgi:hypothetical protein